MFLVELQDSRGRPSPGHEFEEKELAETIAQMADLQGKLEQSGKSSLSWSCQESGKLFWPRLCFRHADSGKLKATFEGERKRYALVLKELGSQL
jgi:hypothetical protein